MKHKYRSLTFAVLLSSIVASAQTDSISKFPGCYITVNAGIGIPERDFKSTSYLGMGGFALQGLQTGLTLDKYVSHKRIGMTFKLAYNTNSFNINAYNSFTKRNGYNPVNTYWSNSYKEISLLIGALYTIPSHEISITASLAAGPSYMTIPDYKTTNNPNTDSIPQYFIFQSDKALPKSASTNLAMFLNGGLSIGYAVTQQLQINLQGDFLYNFTAHKTDYPVTYYSTSNNPNAPYLAYTANTNQYYFMPICILNISLGVTLHLSKSAAKQD